LAFKNYYVTNLATSKAEQKRLEERRALVAKELLTTEETYVKHLQIASETYMATLKNVLDAESFAKIFGNWDTIVQVNKKLLEVFKLHCNQINNVELLLLAKDVLKMLPYLKLYIPYILQYQTAIETVQSVITSKKVQKALKGISETTTNHLDINSFLIMPVRRIPRYSLLFKELERYCNGICHNGFTLIATKLNDICQQMNASTRSYEELKKYQAKLYGKNAIVKTLARMGRRKIAGPLALTWIKKSKAVQISCILCNDLLLLCKKSEKKYKVLACYNLSKGSFQVTESDFGPAMFQLVIGNEQLLFDAFKKEDRDTWLNRFKEVTGLEELDKMESEFDEERCIVA